jgi:tripartite-type tricarboxylate transporter receptor subunit TctC
MLNRIIARGLAVAAVALLATAVQAQGWPNRPVKVINPFPAGGGVDTFSRPLAAKLTATFGQTFYVENIGGAGGTVGAASAAKSPNDGYTIFVGAIHHAIAESMYSKLPYNIERDFDPITIVASVPNVIVMHPKYTQIKTYQDFVAYAKANPGKLNFGSAGAGTSHHLVGELFKQRTGLDLVHIPYKGAGPMMQDLLGGQVDMAFDGMGTSAAQISAGKLKPLAVSSAKRSPVIPDVPTLGELGLPDFDVTSWYAVWVPKGVPKDIQDKLHAALVKALQEPDIKAIWDKQGATAGGQSPAEFAKFLRAEVDRWSKVVKTGNIKLDN